MVAEKVGLPYAGEITTEKEYLTESTTDSDKEKQKYVLTKDTVIDFQNVQTLTYL